MGRNSLVHQAMLDAVKDNFRYIDEAEPIEVMNVCSKAMDSFACISIESYYRMLGATEALAKLHAAGVDN